MLKYNPSLKKHSRSLRKNLTNAEHLLWAKIRRKQILNVQFFRQRPIGEYIVDFYAPTIKLVIELDGSQHFEDAYVIKDKARDDRLTALGLKVMRYSNLQIFKFLQDVLEEIYREVEKLKSPWPPFEKGGPGGICGISFHRIIII